MKRSKKEQITTNLILDVFQLNGLLTQEGDKLTKDLKLTSARWKILGAISLATEAMTVSSIAKMMGQTRQTVQRLSNAMEKDGFLYYENNPNDKRAKILKLKPKGIKCFELLEDKQIPWANSLSKGVTIQELEITEKVLIKLKGNLVS